MTIVNGSSTSDYYYIRLNYTVSSTEEVTSCAITLQLYWKKHHSHNLGNERPCYVSATGQSQANFTPTGSYEKDAGGVVNLGSVTYSWTRGTSDATKNISGYAKRSTGATSSVSTTITVPKRTSYAVTFNENTPSSASGTVANMPSSQTKYYNIDLAITNTVPTLTNWTFTGWNTAADGTGTSYASGATYSGNTALTLYAKWSKSYVLPTIYNIKYQRAEADLSNNDEGDKLKITFNHTQGQVPADTTVNKTTTISVSLNGHTFTSSELFSGTTTFNSTGTKTIVYTAPVSTYPTSSSYPIIVTLTTASDGVIPTVTYTDTLPSSLYPIDLAADGSSLAFGTPTRLKKDIHIDVAYPAVSGTTDYQIYTALNALGWWNQVYSDGQIDFKLVLAKILAAT